MAELTLADGTLHYTVEGAGDSLPLMCLHGGSCRGSDFFPMAERLGDARRLICVDLRGHGESANFDGPFDLPAFAQDIVALAEELELEEFAVVGHSLGGPIALELLRENAPVTAIISIDAPLVLAYEMGAGMQQLVDAFEAGQGPAAFRQFMSAVVGFAADEAAAAELLENLCAVPEKVVEPLVRSVTFYDGTDKLKTSSVPVLHIDAGFGVCNLERLAELRPDAWIGKTVGTGHYPHMESPDQVSAMVRHFLDHHHL